MPGRSPPSSAFSQWKTRGLALSRSFFPPCFRRGTYEAIKKLILSYFHLACQQNYRDFLNKVTVGRYILIAPDKPELTNECSIENIPSFVSPPRIPRGIHNGPSYFLAGFSLEPADHILDPGFRRFISNIHQIL